MLVMLLTVAPSRIGWANYPGVVCFFSLFEAKVALRAGDSGADVFDPKSVPCLVVFLSGDGEQ